MTGGKHRKRYKGDCMMCAHWIRGDGMAIRLPHRDKRVLGQIRQIRRIPRNVRHCTTTERRPEW
jgi:hypothetical protein